MALNGDNGKKTKGVTPHKQTWQTGEDSEKFKTRIVCTQTRKNIMQYIFLIKITLKMHLESDAERIGRLRNEY